MAQNSKLATVWNDAIASGVFEDDDAAEVKGLKALGGPRLYAAKTQDQIKQDAKKKTMDLMNFQHKNLHPNHMHGQVPPAKKPRHSSAKVHQAVKSGAPFGGQRNRTRGNSISNMAGPSRHTAVSSAPRRSVSRPAQGPPKVAHPAQRVVSIPPSEYGGNQQIVDPPNMVARAEVLLTPPGKQGSLQCIVFLTIAPAPSLGFCLMFVDNKLFARFAIAEYQDFMSSDLTLSLHFGLETVLYFTFTFRTASELEGFLKVLRDVKAGKCLVAAIESSASVQKPAAENSVTPAQAAPTKIALDLPAPTKPAPGKFVPAKVAPANTALEKPAVRTPSPTAPKAVQYAARRLTEEPDRSRQLENQHRSGSTYGVLISLEGDDTSPINEPRSSEASTLLSSLQPYSSEDAESSTPTQNGALEDVKLPVAGAVSMLRNILATFIMKNTSRKTKQQLDAAVEGIREAVMDVICQGFTETERQETAAQIEDHMNSSAAVSGERHRVQYTEEELLSMRENQVQPPAWLADVIGELPRRQRPSRVSSVDDVATKEHIRKSTVGMDWVLSKEESPATPKQPPTEKTEKVTLAQSPVMSSQGVQTTGNVNIAPPRTDVGLRASRWSSRVAAPIRNQNAFTGLPYESRWKKGSYMYELAQLDPQAQIDAPVRDLVNFYFPTAGADGELETLASVQMVNGSKNLQSSPSDLSSDAQMGELRRNMARLTLESSSGSRATSCSSVQGEQLIPIEENPTPPTSSFNAAAQTFTPTARTFTPTTSTLPPVTTSAHSSTPTLSGLGSSRHASRAALPTAGQFNFHLPRLHRK
ncbi:hypothetical protein QBC40DRAFT_340613 [Triangularia verruculosa]|uniref:Uncharacterized protein n=1 Tax=Triangularia verruculosa TaxID=2587418 RepID=A0AAN6XHE5_9PEZI|nr:hypothetical protein QBC40DRAFT_340613 [Triangularia verruculosa]